MLGFKSLSAAKDTVNGIEAYAMLRHNTFKLGWEGKMNFALFEDCLNSTQENSYLFSETCTEISAYQAHEIMPALEQIEALSQQGFYLAGYLAYEAANAFYPQLNLTHQSEQPLLHFVAYRCMQQFASQNLAQVMPKFTCFDTKNQCHFDYLELDATFSTYQEYFMTVYQQLVLGNTYQLNLTVPVKLHNTSTNMAKLYFTLSRSHPVSYASYLPFIPQNIISISPELFFKKESGNIQVRPMKGTMPRGNTPQEDAGLSQLLAEDGKNRAENLIIVDLLRNDLAKFCTTGSIQATKLFNIEKYASLFQMTSTIDATLAPQTRLTTILQGLFPCGSITGAPKLSTLQLIEQIENYSRGVYTGAIGYILPNNEMQFSVAIRTLSTNIPQLQNLTLGVGGGITIQSKVMEEWNEIMTKLNFVRKFYQPDFKLIESFSVANGVIHNLQEHLERLGNSAQRLIFSCNLDRINQGLIDYIQQHCQDAQNYKLRLELNHDGVCKIEHSLIRVNSGFLKVAVAPNRLNTRHGLFHHKTNSILTRGSYTQMDINDKPPQIDELIFINLEGVITESRYHNVIIEYAGQLLTTPVSQGLLNGIFRARLVNNGTVKEQSITEDMLQQATAIFLCNDVRGMIFAKLQFMEHV